MRGTPARQRYSPILGRWLHESKVKSSCKNRLKETPTCPLRSREVDRELPAWVLNLQANVLQTTGTPGAFSGYNTYFRGQAKITFPVLGGSRVLILLDSGTFSSAGS
jgi:hypothetical protein